MTKRKALVLLALGSMAIASLLQLPFSTTANAEELTATAVLTSSSGESIGTATFVEGANGIVLVTVTARNLAPGAHGLHIHAVGRCDEPDFTSAGAHFNPYNRVHGFRSSEGAHAGDLPNLMVGQDGRGTLVFADTVINRFTLRGGPGSILDADGSALIIHAGPDDEITDPTGNSGARVACALISAGAPAPTGPAVRPPSTGDAGLAEAYTP